MLDLKKLGILSMIIIPRGGDAQGTCLSRPMTTPYAKGPYYQEDGVNMGDEICAVDDWSTIETPRFSISGVIYESECGTPINGTLVEVWQADDQGDYDPITDLTSSYCRVQTITEEDGVYAFDTMLPGKYADDNGVMRPVHFHYRLSAPGCDSLFTQMIMEGDPDISSGTGEDLIRPIMVGPDGSQFSTFDITLSCETTTVPIEMTQAQRRACRADHGRLCPTTVITTPEAYACLINWAPTELALTCAVALELVEPPPPPTELPRRCRGDARNLCPDMEPAEQLACLFELDVGVLKSKCRKELYPGLY